MAKDLTPDAWISSWSSNGTNITIPIASITGLTSGEANTSTGDIRAVVLKLMTTLLAAQTALASEDKPTTFVISDSASSNAKDFRVRFTGSTGTFAVGSEA